MKNFLKAKIKSYLNKLTQAKLQKSHKTIIGITGSVGKTTCKTATVHILKKHFSVDETTGNYNTDFGLMLSILKQSSGGKNPFKWAKSLVGATTNFAFNHNKYEKLVLEMGIDKPGDMDDLLKVAIPDIAIVTEIAPVHLAKDQFKSTTDIFNEKIKIIKNPKTKIAILNYNTPCLRKLETEKSENTKIFFGSLPTNQNPKELPIGLYIDKIKSTKKGLNVKLINTIPPISPKTQFHLNSQSPHLQITNLKIPILGKQNIFAILPAIIVGILSSIPLEEINLILENYKLPKGRMNKIPGIKKSTIIDSSYNASPKSVSAALEVLWEYPSQRKIAVLGNMNELGEQSHTAHRKIGIQVPKYAQMLITVGNEARIIAQSANNHGMPKHLIKSFKTAEEAGEFLKYNLRHNDVVLVKGSQNNVNLEKCIKIIMAHPEKAKDLLVRQY